MPEGRCGGFLVKTEQQRGPTEAAASVPTKRIHVQIVVFESSQGRRPFPERSEYGGSYLNGRSVGGRCAGTQTRGNPAVTATSVAPSTSSTSTAMGTGVLSPFGAECVQEQLPGGAPSPPPSSIDTNNTISTTSSIPPMNTSGKLSLHSDFDSHGSVPPVSQISTCPPHGAKAVCGRRSKMEDAFAIQEDFVVAPDMVLPPLLPAQLASRHTKALAEPFDNVGRFHSDHFNNGDTSSELSSESSTESLHFFGVFDGHGGVEAATHCADRLHRNVQDAWWKKIDGAAAASTSCCTCETGSDAWSNYSGRSSATSEDVKGVFVDAFCKTDEEFNNASDVSALVGSTAVIALVGSRYYLVANCGDSRAVLCRGGTAHPLTVDHKPEREDEMARVEEAGGQVWFWNGARVMGVLAMSRAIGDRSLRPYVIPDPEVTIVPRTGEDSLLIMATDGLWDVVNDDEACTLAMKCLERARQKGATEADATRLTATVLIRAAMDRGSRDNITVVVVDLRSNAKHTNTGQKYFTGTQVSGSSQVSSVTGVDRQMACQVGMEMEPKTIAAADEVMA